MFATLRFQSALLCGLVLCLASASNAQTVSYGEATSEKPKSEDVFKNLSSIELKLEAVLDLLPATLSGQDLETARKQINAAFETMVDGVKKNTPVVGYGAPNPVNKDAQQSNTKQAIQSPVGRYQISSWILPPTGEEGKARVGAFIINTQSGRIWKHEGSGRPLEVHGIQE